MDAELESSDLYVKVMDWLFVHRKTLLIVVIALALIGSAWGVMSWKKGQDESDANAQFFAVPIQSMTREGLVSPGALLEVAKEYPSTAAGEYARILGAGELFTQGKYDEAHKQFTEFLSTYPDSPLIQQANLGVAACLEAEGKDDEAIRKYYDITKSSNPGELSIIAPAKLTLARLYQKNNELQKAFMAYVELSGLLRQNQYDPWGAEAQERARLLASEYPELMQSLTNAAPSRPAGGITVPSAAGQTGGKPVPSFAPGPAVAPKVQPPSAPPTGPVPKLLTTPGASSNSAGKP